MAEEKVKDDNLNVRVNSDTIEKFKEICAKENRPYTWVIREMIEAYVDNRITIVIK